MNKTQIICRLLAVVLWALLFWVVLALSSCASKKAVTQTQYIDSVSVQYIHDNTYLHITDTALTDNKKEKFTSEDTGITFVEQGGTYNTLTGEATGVRSVKQTKKEKEQEQTIVQQAREIEAYKTQNDSLRTALKVQSVMTDKQQNTEEIKPKTSTWHRFLVWWFWITALIALCIGGYFGLKLYRKFAIKI